MTPPLPRSFIRLWAGQTLSLVGTEVTAIGVSFVAFLDTGSLAWLAALYLAIRVPALLLSPHAGSTVDRLSPKAVLIGADLVAGAATTLAIVLHLADALALWHLVGLAAVGSLANAYQLPAYQAAVPTLVGGEALPRAHGLLQLGPAAGLLVAPALAGAAVAAAGIGALLAIDIATFVIAIAATWSARFPQQATPPAEPDRGEGESGGSLRATWSHLSDGRLRGVRRLVLWGTAINFAVTALNLLLPALLLTLTSETTTGLVIGAGGAAMLASSIGVSARGLPERRVATLLAAGACIGVGIVLVGLRPELPVVVAGVIITLAAAPVIGAASGTIHQSEVALAWQGRHAAFRRVVSESMTLPAVLLMTPLVERVAEPAVASGGWGADTIGRIVGVGDGRGYGLTVVVAGLAVLLIVAAMSRDPWLRQLDSPVSDTGESSWRRRSATSGVATEPDPEASSPLAVP